jgi:hypothetical protein
MCRGTEVAEVSPPPLRKETFFIVLRIPFFFSPEQETECE